MTMKRTVSVVVPARDEEKNIAPLIGRLPVLGASTEVVFVEGHSKDHTRREIERAAERHAGRFKIVSLTQSGKGKAGAVNDGIMAATGDIVIILDSDITVQPEELAEVYAAFDRGAEFVNGSRLVFPHEPGAFRRMNLWGNHFFAWLVGKMVGTRLTDTLCGTKAFLRSDYPKMLAALPWAHADPFGDFTFIFGAAALGRRIAEVPLHYRARSYGVTKISRFKDGWTLFKLCARHAFRWPRKAA